MVNLDLFHIDYSHLKGQEEVLAHIKPQVPREIYFFIQKLFKTIDQQGGWEMEITRLNRRVAWLEGELEEIKP